ncbi:MAG TPA: proton-conducting transporter membrane subunit [Candidatus Acidoferrales bacterium]|nr:proton-conducting transporter membrane subunit [Candidatus Acidoferrales bacterium]
MPAAAARDYRRVASGVRSNEAHGAPMTTLPLTLNLWAIAICILGVDFALIVKEHWAPRVLVIACCSAAVLSFVGGAICLAVGPSGDVVLWTFPVIGSITIGTTTIASWFACVAALVYVPTSLFTLRYLERYADRYSMRAFTIWYCALLAAIIGLFICRDVTWFFIDWEVIAITSALLVAFEWRHTRNARAAFVMLGMSEAGTMAALLAMLLARGGSLWFGGPPIVLSGGLSWAVFLLAFFGFGVKAGLLPINSWLPRAHPIAPGNVSALLSGVILNVGVYGIVLVNMVLAPSHMPIEGLVVMIVGAASAIVGILYATIVDDMKAMLAYSSIENIGIVITALGAALVFMAVGEPFFAGIGFAAAMYHLANHSVYKGLLFLGASTVDMKLGTRSMNALGGIIRVLPITTALFLVGVLAISAIPPLNGFVSEWMTFQALLRSAELAPLTFRVIFALCGAVLALTAALTVTCFVKVFGMSFLGWQRTERPKPTEASRSMLVGMGLLAVACVFLGTLPTYVLPVIGRAATGVFGSDVVTGTLVPPFFRPSAGPNPLPADFVTTFHALGAQIGAWLPGRGLVVMLRGGDANPVVFAMSTTYLCLIISVLLVVTYVIVRIVTRARRADRAKTWAGGMTHVPTEMTYTATGFSNPVRVIFDAVFDPTEVENTRETIHQHFRSAIRRTREDVFLSERLVSDPLTHAVRRAAALLARMHHGRLSAYVGYALGTLLIVLAIVSVGQP